MAATWTTPKSWPHGGIWKRSEVEATLRDNLNVLSIHQHTGAAGDGVDINTIAFGS